MRTLYRLVYRDGSHGAWSADLERVKANARLFKATIESREFLA